MKSLMVSILSSIFGIIICLFSIFLLAQGYFIGSAVAIILGIILISIGIGNSENRK